MLAQTQNGITRGDPLFLFSSLTFDRMWEPVTDVHRVRFLSQAVPLLSQKENGMGPVTHHQVFMRTDEHDPAVGSSPVCT